MFPGAAGRFAELVTWPEVDRVLRQHRLDFPRLRLAMDGEAVPAHTYTEMVDTRRTGKVPRLQAAPFTEQLRKGATLVLDSVNEMFEPVAELALRLEHELRERVQVNLYAGWGKTHGFDVHWDDHDAFILQLSGRKRWRMHGVTRAFPLQRDVEQPPVPAGEPIADFILEDGDALYLPRGHWHDVSALGEESLHLTIGFNRATGVDLVAWLADQLRSEELFRIDLPRFAAPEGRAERSAQVRERIVELLGDDIVDRFLADRDAQAPAHPRFGLPWTATSDLLPASDQAEVRFLAPRAVIDEDETSITIAAGGKRLRFAAVARLVLNELVDGQPRSVDSLVKAAQPGLDRSTVRALLGELIAYGLVTSS